MNKFFFIIILFCRLSFAQTLDFVKEDYSSSIVSIKNETPGFVDDKKAEFSSFATGVIIKQDKEKHSPDPNFQNYIYTEILTCAHINNANAKLTIITMNNITANATILKQGNEIEIDLMHLACYIPVMVPLEIGELPENQSDVIVVGLGSYAGRPKAKENIRTFKGKKIGPKHTLFLDTFPMPGDSGGPLIQNNKVVGIVSGGYNWYVNQENKQIYTWPLLSASTTKIKEFLK